MGQPNSSDLMEPTTVSNASCYLCGQETLSIIRNRLRYNVKRNVLKCTSCGLVYLEPNAVDLEDYYKEDYRTKYTPVLGKKMSPREIFEMNKPYQPARIKPIQHLLRPDLRVLDVGCSAGFFLDTLRPHVGECIGIELNREDARFVNEEVGIKTYTTPIEETDLEEASFDLITMFHVLEHIDDPVTLLSTLRRYLKPGGHIYIEVPNVEDALLSVYQVDAYADFWYREPHVFNFSPSTLKQTMAKAGFEGESHTFQRYSLLNHTNWVMTGKPQSSMVVGMGAPTMIHPDNEVDDEVRTELDAWLNRVNEEYKKLLDKHGRGDCVRYVGGLM